MRLYKNKNNTTFPQIKTLKIRFLYNTEDRSVLYIIFLLFKNKFNIKIKSLVSNIIRTIEWEQDHRSKPKMCHSYSFVFVR